MIMNRRVGVGCALSLFVASCGGATEQGTEFEFTFHRPPNGAFAFESVIAIDQNVNRANKAVLTSVTFEVETPGGTTLGFLEDAEANVIVGDQHTPLVSFEGSHASAAPLTVLYHGDLRPMFPDGHTIVVAWQGHVDTRATWPADGIKVKIRIGIGT